MAVIESPLEVSRSCDADSLADGDLGHLFSHMDFDPAAYPLAVEAQIDPESLAEPTGSACELSYIADASPLAHQIQASCGLSRPDQHRARSFGIRREVKTVVHSVNEVYVNVSEGMLHYDRLPGTHNGMRSGIGCVGLGFDDAGATAADDHFGADEVPGNFGRVAREKIRF